MNENTKNYLLGAVAVLTVVNTILIFTWKSDGGRVIETPASAGNTGIVAPNNDQMQQQKTFDASQMAQQQQQPEPAKPQGPPTTLAFANMEHDFGTIKQDTKNKHIFSFTNTGDEPLIISNAKGSCGCTVPKYPREPISPGGTGEIEVEYSPGKQKGKQAKTVTITANTEPANTVLRISAQVEEV